MPMSRPPSLRSRLLRARKKLLASPRSLLLPFLFLNFLIVIAFLNRSPPLPFSLPHRSNHLLSLHRHNSLKLAINPSLSLPSTHSNQRSPWFSRSSSFPLYSLNTLQQDVRNVTRALYRTYFTHCRGRDEFIPTTNNCADWYNIGLTTLDSIDTLLLMGLRPEYEASRQWAETSLNFSAIRGRVSTFELVIRALGGMLSAHQMSGDTIWLRKSVELGNLLLPFFEATKSGCPPMNVDFYRDRSPRGHAIVVESHSTPADAGTLQLEMRTLSALTGDKRFAIAADRCMRNMLSRLPSARLAPPMFNVQTSQFGGARYTIGGSVDSFYEMLVKTWVASGRDPDDILLKHGFTRAVEAIYSKLHGVAHGDLHFLGERTGTHGRLKKQMDHLACFFPGTLVVGALHGLGGGMDGRGNVDYLPRARRLARTCYAMTRSNPTGLAGEITDFGGVTPSPKVGHDVSRLRPEIVEALFYLDKADSQAGDRYKRWGRQMWTDMRRAAQVRGKADGIMCGLGNLRVKNAGMTRVEKEGKLDSFVIAETMKYFFLLFDGREMRDGPFPLDEWVFNTEAHPMRIRPLF